MLSRPSWLDPYRFDLTRLELRPRGWPAALDGFTILHLSDLHTRQTGPVEAFVKQLGRQVGQPDLLVVTGDFAESVAAVGPCLEALGEVTARYGRFAVLGNNDLAPRALREALATQLPAAGLRVLRDESVRIDTGHGAFWLGGILYYFVRRTIQTFVFPVARAFEGALPGEPRILLAHSPDAIVEAAEEGVCLMLSGHTHGGQICLPGGIPVHSNLYRFRFRYLRGLHRRGATLLYVNRGLGLSPPQIRVWCRPEAAYLTLRSESSKTT